MMIYICFLIFVFFIFNYNISDIKKLVTNFYIFGNQLNKI